jgi:hypothetical protein
LLVCLPRIETERKEKEETRKEKKNTEDRRNETYGIPPGYPQEFLSSLSKTQSRYRCHGKKEATPMAAR